MRINMIFFAIIIKKQSIEELTKQEKHQQEIKQHIDEMKLKHLHL